MYTDLAVNALPWCTIYNYKSESFDLTDYSDFIDSSFITLVYTLITPSLRMRAAPWSFHIFTRYWQISCKCPLLRIRKKSHWRPRTVGSAQLSDLRMLSQDVGQRVDKQLVYFVWEQILNGKQGSISVSIQSSVVIECGFVECVYVVPMGNEYPDDLRLPPILTPQGN